MNSPLPAGNECDDCNHVGRCAFISNNRLGKQSVRFRSQPVWTKPRLYYQVRRAGMRRIKMIKIKENQVEENVCDCNL